MYNRYIGTFGTVHTILRIARQRIEEVFKLEEDFTDDYKELDDESRQSWEAWREQLVLA